jgi:hypothetical protein
MIQCRLSSSPEHSSGQKTLSLHTVHATGSAPRSSKQVPQVKAMVVDVCCGSTHTVIRRSRDCYIMFRLTTRDRQAALAT